MADSSELIEATPAVIEQGVQELMEFEYGRLFACLSALQGAISRHEASTLAGVWGSCSHLSSDG